MAFYANAPLPDYNARQMAQTIRQPSTALLTIDSEDRYVDYLAARANPTSPYNFAIIKNESLMPGFMTRIGISEIVFPWTIPNINNKTNLMKLTYISPLGTTVNGIIQLSNGFYTPHQLATIITTETQAYISSIPGNTDVFTMTYGGISGEAAIPAFAYSIQSTGVPVLTFIPMTYNSAAYPYPSSTKQLYDLLGFLFPTTPDIPIVNGIGYYTGAFTLAQGFRYVDIVCNQLTNSQAQKDQTSQTIARDMLCRIYVGSGGGDSQSTVLPSDPTFCPPGCSPFVIYRNFTMPKQIQWIPNQNIPGYLQFQVYDDTGALLDEAIVNEFPTYGGVNSPGARTDWSMTMLVSEN